MIKERKQYHYNGKLFTLEYFDNDNLPHNDEGPAFIIFNKKEVIEHVYYYNHGILHREDGPAYINYFNGEIFIYHYVYNGIELKARTLEDSKLEIKTLCLR